MSLELPLVRSTSSVYSIFLLRSHGRVPDDKRVNPGRLTLLDDHVQSLDNWHGLRYSRRLLCM